MSTVMVQINIDNLPEATPEGLMEIWHRIPYVINSTQLRLIKNIVKETPNDQELGQKIREHFTNNNL